MRHGQKIYPSHHRIEMAVEIASLKCQHSSINQSSTRKNSDSTTGRLLWDLLMGIGNSSSNVVLTWKARCWYYFLWWEDHKVNWEQRGLSLLNLFNWKWTELNWKRAEPSDGLKLKPAPCWAPAIDNKILLKQNQCISIELLRSRSIAQPRPELWGEVAQGGAHGADPKATSTAENRPRGETARVAPFPELLGAGEKYWAACSIWQVTLPAPMLSQPGVWLVLNRILHAGGLHLWQGQAEGIPTQGALGSLFPQKGGLEPPASPQHPELGLFGAPAAQFWQKRGFAGALWAQGDHRTHGPAWDPGAAKVLGGFGKAKPPEGGQVLLRGLCCVGTATLFKNLATNLYHTVLKLDHFACIAVLGERFRYTFELSDFYFFLQYDIKKRKCTSLLSFLCMKLDELIVFLSYKSGNTENHCIFSLSSLLNIYRSDFYSYWRSSKH